MRRIAPSQMVRSSRCRKDCGLGRGPGGFLLEGREELSTWVRDLPLGRDQPLRCIPLLCSPGLERHIDEALKDRPVDRDDFIIAQGCDHLDPHNVAGHDETADL